MSHPLRHSATSQAETSPPPRAAATRAPEPDAPRPQPQSEAAASLRETLSGPLTRLRSELLRAFVFAGFVTIFVDLGVLFLSIYDMILYYRLLQSKNMDTVTALTIGLFIAMALYGALEFCRSGIFVVMADRFARRLNLPALQAAMSKSLEGSASSGAQAMRDLNELRLFLSGSSATIPLDLILTPPLLVVLFMLHPAYGVYALFCTGLLFLLSLITDLSTREELIRANGTNAKSLNDLSAALRQTELLDGMGMLPAVARRWSERQHNALADLKRASRQNKALLSLAKGARLGMQAGLMILGTVLVLHDQSSTGGMMASNLLLGKLLVPFEHLVSGWRQWTSAMAAWGRVRDLISSPGQRRGNQAPERSEGRLVLDHVTYSATGRTEPILADVSFAVEPGEAIGIVGPSGSGKSTLARLIVGMFLPSEGNIQLDGLSTEAWDRTALGRNVGYLPQSIALLDGTIIDNIARMEESDPAPVIEAAIAAGVHDVIGRLPDGYATWIGGAGYALSGGQQQRVALARALFGEPKLLVLDEPNANLDHVGEQSLVQTIASAKRKGASVILVTHRPAILSAVDRIVMIKKGRIERIMRAEDYFGTNNPRLATPEANSAPPNQLATA
jgi:ATP-binding cassette, subfamily C, bacterial